MGMTSKLYLLPNRPTRVLEPRTDSSWGWDFESWLAVTGVELRIDVAGLILQFQLAGGEATSVVLPLDWTLAEEVRT